MALIHLLLTISLLWLNLLGLGLLLRPTVGSMAVARVAGVLALVLSFFFVEHFVGLGGRLWLLPVSTAISVWLIHRRRAAVREWGAAEGWFALGFFYCLLWRFTFPNIDNFGERMPNLMLIESYLTGGRLPPMDRWLPPFEVNFYYSLQHYGAALLGRWLGTSPGMTYHLAYCTVAGLLAVCLGGMAHNLGLDKKMRGLIFLVLFCGGSGAALVAWGIGEGLPNVHDCVRFLGGKLTHENLNAVGKTLAEWTATPGVTPRDVPLEPLSYLLMNGDYHAPLGGHLLQFFALLLMSQTMSGATTTRRWEIGWLGATVPLVLVSNAWVFPLHGILVVGWLAYRSLEKERGVWPSAAVGVSVAGVLLYPFLSYFTQQTTSAYVAIQSTLTEDRTPLLAWMLVFWPAVLLILLGWWNRERRSLVLFWGASWILLLGLTEFFYNNDLYGGSYNRFNTSLKWWGWVFTGAIFSLGTINLASKNRFCKWGTALVLLGTCAFALPLGHQFLVAEKIGIGKLTGSAWLEGDPVIKDVMTALEARPDGLALQSGLVMANSQSPGVVLFGRKKSYLGWPWHETTWRGDIPEIQSRLRQINDFYSGKMEQPLAWLLENDIRYITWLINDNVEENSRFAPIHAQIKSGYAWHHFYGDTPQLAIGFWERIETDSGKSLAETQKSEINVAHRK